MAGWLWKRRCGRSVSCEAPSWDRTAKLRLSMVSDWLPVCCTFGTVYEVPRSTGVCGEEVSGGCQRMGVDSEHWEDKYNCFGCGILGNEDVVPVRVEGCREIEMVETLLNWAQLLLLMWLLLMLLMWSARLLNFQSLYLAAWEAQSSTAPFCLSQPKRSV